MILLLVSVAGAALFAWPLLGFAAPPALPVLAAMLLCVAVLGASERTARRLDSRALAVLAVIAAVDAALRMALVNGIGGFSPIFFLILCTGYAFGPGYGFVTGAIALFVSGIATGGVGIWIPYEMLGCGWCGALAGLAGSRRHGEAITRRDLVVLATVGAVTGIAYGFVLDIWDWSLLRDAPGIGWVPGLSPLAEFGNFLHFYLVTSVTWDVLRAVGNVVLIVAVGRPVLVALIRLRRRFHVEIDALAADAA